MDPTDHEDIIWLHTQLTGHVNDLSNIYEHVANAIRRLQDEKEELQSKVDQLEQDNPSAEVRRLRNENSILRARLANTAKERAEVVRERDALIRKLHSIRQLIDGPAFDEGDTTTDAQNGQPGPRSATSTVRPQHDTHAAISAQHPIPTPELTSPTHTHAHTVLSEPKTDVTTIHDSFGRVILPHPVPLPQLPEAAASPSTSAHVPSQTVQPLSTHTPATFIDGIRTPDQDATSSARALSPPYVDAREPSSSPLPPLPLSPPPVFRPLYLDLSGSPLRGSQGGPRILSLNSSPGMSEDLSAQYDESSRPLSGTASKVTVQKWRVHFAKPPLCAASVALPKPVTTATLLQNLELDEDTRRSIEGLSSVPAGNLRLYIHDVLGLAFLYDPVLLEAPEATYVVEWSDVKASQNSKAYITAAREKHSELHTFIYASRKNGWHYLGQQRWSLADIKSIWHTLSQQAQRALANRAYQNADPAEISRRLKKGQIEQLTVELLQVSLLQPSPGESALMKKLM